MALQMQVTVQLFTRYGVDDGKSCDGSVVMASLTAEKTHEATSANAKLVVPKVTIKGILTQQVRHHQ